MPDIFTGLVSLPSGSDYYQRAQNYDVRTYGAAVDGTTPDATKVQAAIDACYASGGGAVWIPSPTRIESPGIVLKSGVVLVGPSAPVGWVFGSPRSGALLVPDYAGAYDVVSTPVGTQVIGSGLVNIGFDGSVDTAHWLLRTYGSVGMTLRNIAVRQSATGANGIYLHGGNSGTYQAEVDHIALNCGGGYLGGTSLLMGSALGPANANTVIAPECQGYGRGIDDSVGGGNLIVNPWLQSCTVAVRFNSSQCVMVGGWFEQNTTTVIWFDVGSVNCSVLGGRNAGQNGAATMVTKGGVGNVCRDLEGFNRTGAQSIALGGPSPVTYTNAECLPIVVTMWGGTITSVTKNSVAFPTTGTIVMALEPGESFTFAYTATPNFVIDRK